MIASGSQLAYFQVQDFQTRHTHYLGRDSACHSMLISASSNGRLKKSVHVSLPTSFLLEKGPLRWPRDAIIVYQIMHDGEKDVFLPPL